MRYKQNFKRFILIHCKKALNISCVNAHANAYTIVTEKWCQQYGLKQSDLMGVKLKWQKLFVASCRPYILNGDVNCRILYLRHV